MFQERASGTITEFIGNFSLAVSSRDHITVPRRSDCSEHALRFCTLQPSGHGRIDGQSGSSAWADCGSRRGLIERKRRDKPGFLDIHLSGFFENSFAEQPQCFCHDTLPWLISGALGLTHFCATFYCALTSVWRTSSHFPLFFTQTLALLYVPDMSLPSEVCCIVALYLITATSALGKTTFMSANE